MKHKGYVIIKKPIAVVTQLFADPTHLKEYQDGFIRKELVSGKQGKKDSISKLYYQHGKQEMELTETVTNNSLPNLFEASYHHIHMDNTMKCSFSSIDKNETRYAYEFEYTRINWVMPKLIAILFPSMYSKPAEKWMRQFKKFVEKQ